MFDVSFSEMLIVAVVAVIVVGPKRLPKTVRAVAHVLGRAQRYVSDIKADIQREMELEDLKKVRQSIQEVGKDIERSVRATINDAEESARSVGQSLRSVESELESAIDDTSKRDTPSQTSGETDATPPDTKAAASDGQRNEPSAESSAKPSAEPLVEPPVIDSHVPSFLQGDVKLSIPETPASNDTQVTAAQKT
ncbi:MAG: Sec-independent protein translocase protein TatB [Burkholderiales bacterium]|jgi:sec-independent protein translocase protein TatB|nr:Sec-independent protein translocase protein TatB [Burkholderiales bacterium]